MFGRRREDKMKVKEINKACKALRRWALILAEKKYVHYKAGSRRYFKRQASKAARRIGAQLLLEELG